MRTTKETFIVLQRWTNMCNMGEPQRIAAEESLGAVAMRGHISHMKVRINTRNERIL